MILNFAATRFKRLIPLQNQQGAIAILFALMLLPLLGMAGMAVDGMRMFRVQSDLHQALETAAFAGLKGNSVAERSALARDFFETNWQANGHKIVNDGSIGVSLDHPADSHFLIGKAHYRMETVFLLFIGIRTVDVNTSVEIDLNKVYAQERHW